MELKPLNLYPLFEKEMQSWQEANPNHTYQLQASGDLEGAGGLAEEWPKVYADQGRVRQVMRNLLSNATKYSPGGGTITVSAMLVGGYLEVTVADEGIGLTKDELTHIFEKFWRADASSTAVEGTGLGLVHVKHIVGQHGGRIWVESTKGEGTVVHFSLPLVDRQMTVLIVEDEDSVREIEQRILTRNDVATLAAACGQEAIEIAQTHHPDLILLDLVMPGMSGKEVLQALKANPATAHIPIIVVSARSDWQTIEDSYILGAVDFLTKPFEYEELLNHVRRTLKISVGSRGQPASSQ
jgi:CheY-like chemotaxis protein